MKKLVLFATAIIALSFASCANKGNADATEQNDTTATTIEAPAVEPAATDTVTETVDTAKVEATAAPEAK